MSLNEARKLLHRALITTLVAILAGAAGMISVALGKSGALVGVAISITTIPAAADLGLSTAYGDWSSVSGAAIQLALNILGLLLSSAVVLALMRSYSERRIVAHRSALGLGPIPSGPPPDDDALEAYGRAEGADAMRPSSPAPTPTPPRSSSRRE